MTREEFASDEEYHFHLWLTEAMEYGLVSSVQYQPPPFPLCDRKAVPIEKQLKTKVKVVEKFLCHPHSYQADFLIQVPYPFCGAFFPESGDIWIDTKGGFMNRGAKQEFSINQKWVMDRYKIYINKVVPEKLFKQTWVPEPCRWTPKQGKPVKKYLKCRTIKEFVGKLKRN